MAYAHRWYGEVVLCQALLADITVLALAADAEISGWNGEGLPELLGQHVRFNGSRARGEDAECFAVHDGLNDGTCQTAGQPYDELVGATLLRMLRYNPKLNIESDGSWRSWRAARNLYLRAFGELPPRPSQV